MSIESYPSPNGVLTSLIWRKTATGGETSLSGYDNASQALSYTPGQEQVYLNGILLVRGSDYTATNGTSITGLTALTVDDFVQVNCYNNFSVASLPAASITGSISNAQLANSSITINGSAVSLGGSVSLPGDIESVTASSPLTGGGSSGALTIGIQSASTSQAGSVQLSDSTSTTSSVLAATPTAVKSAYDLADGAIPKTLVDAKGDLIVATADNTPARLASSASNGNVLTVDTSTATGLKWSAPAGGGKVLQAVSVNVADGTSISSSTPTDATGFTATITPTSSTSKILVLISCQLRITRNSDYFTTGAVRLLRGATSLAEYDGGIATTDGSPSNGMAVMLSGIYAFNYYDNPASTSALTYKLQGWVPFGTLAINGNGPGSITLLEIGA